MIAFTAQLVLLIITFWIAFYWPIWPPELKSVRLWPILLVCSSPFFLCLLASCIMLLCVPALGNAFFRPLVGGGGALSFGFFIVYPVIWSLFLGGKPNTASVPPTGRERGDRLKS
jgi:hypothetical protein